ncbi:TPA: CaiF/GrlA family transcriptional regulator [Salmonella enterica]|uniref:CaiF/GrlA family transcriptional regulator n=1 Tax=Salmonella enterica TaxID=28901 RepID=UPI0019BC0784|nr:CaiF/GrlA family transcriptional regulator [Salmonella enterica]MDL2989157.1 CaiF/GrlA family transcriptional regulator [Salmonella enterica]HAK6771615.1 CaiF/GrlA family transcriptional regulator [Salmonella enterica]HAK6818098.1 CaiF/GrlA family transcriptional regulator [Salmonella enterica]
MKKQKKPVQGNHEGCHIPRGMEGYSDRPIYIIVALWCLHKKDWVNRNDIARAFKLSERKASFQLSYLMKKRHVIDSEVRRVKSEGSPTTCYEIRVTAVSLEKKVAEECRSPPRGAGSARKFQVGNATKEQRQLLRKLWSGSGKKK